MERGSRLNSLFQNLEKLTTQRQMQKSTPEDLQQLRQASSKLLQLVTTQEKVNRELIIKNSAYVDQILSTLEYSLDTTVQLNILYTLNELIGKTNTGKRTSALVSHGATHVLFQIVVYESREETISEDLLVTAHQILAKLGPKDRKFGVKARLSQALPVTLNLVKSLAGNAKLLQPIVHVLKIYATNAVNASYLGKSGAVSHLFKILSTCGKKHLILLKHSLDTLGSLVKSKSNSARATGHGGVPILLNMYYDWHRSDSRNRHVALRKAILNVLKHITNLKSGRKALMESDGIRILYNTCLEVIECRELESVIFMASLIMRKCFPKNRLPIESLRSPLSYPVPQSDFHVVDAGEGQGDDNGYESSIDNDDDVSSDDDPEANKMESDDDGDPAGENDAPYRRPWDDLCQYKKFFPELHEFDLILDDESGLMPSANQCPIVIPTANQDSIRLRPPGPPPPNSHSQEDFSSHTRSQRFSSRSSMPNLTSLHSSNSSSNNDDLPTQLPNRLDELRLGGMNNFDTDSANDVLLASTARSQRARLKGLFSDTSESSSLDGCLTASAVNLKTGSSVFSLQDLSAASTVPSSSRKSKHRPKSPKDTSKSKKKKVPTATLR